MSHDLGERAHTLEEQLNRARARHVELISELRGLNMTLRRLEGALWLARELLEAARPNGAEAPPA